MSLGTITVELELKDDGTFSGRLVKAGQELKKFESTAERTSRSVQRIERRVRGFSATLRDSILMISQARGALINVRLVTTDWMRSIIETNAEIERMTFLLKGMSSASTEMGRMQEARQNVEWLFDAAQSAPFSVNALTDSFVKLKSVGIDPSAGAMQGLTNAIAAFGGNDNLLHRASIAIQQMGGKGVISMEELRQQLGEAIPQAFTLMARAAGRSVQDMVELIATGTVEAKSHLALLLNEFEASFGGRAAAMMDTWTGMVARAQTKWMLLQKQVGDAGAMEAAKLALQGVIDALDSPQVVAFAKDMGRAMASLVTWTQEAVSVLYDMRTDIIRVGAALVAYLIGSRVIQGVLALGGAFRQTGGMIGGVLPAIDAWGAKMATATAAGHRLGAITIGLTGIVRGLGFALSALAGPFGIVLAVGWALADFFDLFGLKVENTKEKLLELDRVMTKAEKGQFEEAIIDQAEAVKTLDERLTAAMKVRRRLIERGKKVPLGIEQDVINLSRELEAETKKLVALEQKLAVASAELTRSLGERDAANQYRDFTRDLGMMSAEYEKAASEIYAVINDKEATEEAEEAARRALRDTKLAHFEALVTRYREQLTEVEATIANGLTGQQLVAAERFRQLLLEGLNAAQQQVDNTREILANGGTILADDDPTRDARNAFEKYLDNLTAKAAELNDELAGGGGLLAKVKSLVEAGKFGILEEGQKEELYAAASEVERLTALIENRNKAQSANKQITDELQKASAEAYFSMRALFDPSSADQTSEAIARARIQLQEYVTVIKQAGGDWQAAQASANAAVTQMEQNLQMQAAAGLRSRNRDLRLSLMTEKDAIRDRYDYEIQRMRQMLDSLKLTGDERVEAERLIQEQMSLLTERYFRDMETPMEQLMRKWSQTTERMQEASANWMNDFSQQLTTLVTTGKADFKSLATSIIADLVRIRIQAALSGLFNMLGNSIGGLFGGGTAAPLSNADSGFFMPNGPVQVHSGGVVGADKLRAWMGAQKFHGGGLVGGKRFKSNEVPAVLEKGEGVFTEGQMDALSRRLSTPNVSVNVINQSGQQLDAEQGGGRFDGEKYVLDVVLKAATRPGGFRTSLKQAVSN